MFRRASMTILLLGRNSLARADFTGGRKPRLLNLWSQDRPDADSLATLTEVALSLGPKPGRKVWVLDAGLWAQAVYPTAALPANLPRSELERALAFEAEPLSGIPGLDSVVGQVALPPVGGERGYWVVQARAYDFSSVTDVVRAAGGTLAGLGHPAGLPRCVEAATANGPSWQRVELWPDLVALIHGENGKPAKVSLVHGDPQQGRWRVEESRWQAQLGSVANREILTLTGELTLLDGEGKIRSQMEGKPVQELWLTAWAEQLAASPETLPLIRPVPQPMSQQQRVAVSAMLALLCGGVCAGHRWMEKQDLEETRQETQRVLEPGKRIAEIQKQVKDLETRGQKLQKEIDAAQQNHDTLLVQRRRLVALMRSLAEHPPDDVMIQKIDVDSGTGEPGIHGLCLKTGMADQMARTLTPVMLPLGWHVQQPKYKAKNILNDGGPWTFEMLFKPVPVEKPVEPNRPVNARS